MTFTNIPESHAGLRSQLLLLDRNSSGRHYLSDWRSPRSCSIAVRSLAPDCRSGATISQRSVHTRKFQFH